MREDEAAVKSCGFVVVCDRFVEFLHYEVDYIRQLRTTGTLQQRSPAGIC